MARIAAAYGATLLVLLALDAGWLTLVAGPQFKATLGDLLVPGFRRAPAVLFYLMYAAMVVVFVLPRGTGWPALLGYGALFGLACYGTYDLTNLATLKPWTLKLAVPDMVWGMVQTAVAAAVGGWVQRLVQ